MFIGIGDGCADGVVLDGVVACLLGIFIPGIFIPGILLILCFFAGARLLVGLRRLLATFRFAFALGFDPFIPGMFCMSWPCGLALLVDESISPVMMTADKPAIRMKPLKPNHFIAPPEPLVKQSDENVHTKAHVRANIRYDFLKETKF